MCDLPGPETEPIGRQILNHWTTRGLHIEITGETLKKKNPDFTWRDSDLISQGCYVGSGSLQNLKFQSEARAMNPQVYLSNRDVLTRIYSFKLE